MGLSTIERKAKDKSLQLSRENPNKYIIPQYCFGWVPDILSRLSVHSPGDSAYNWYVLNGQIKQFTGKQKIKQQNACMGCE